MVTSLMDTRDAELRTFATMMPIMKTMGRSWMATVRQLP